MVANPARNPFYVLLIVVGVAFLVTACAYGVMAFRDVATSETEQPPGSGLMEFMDRYGMLLLGAEVILLGLFTVGAIGTDEFWQRHLQKDNSASPAQGERLLNEGDNKHEDSKGH
jgi:hypothetical protein